MIDNIPFPPPLLAALAAAAVNVANRDAFGMGNLLFLNSNGEATGWWGWCCGGGKYW